MPRLIPHIVALAAVGTLVLAEYGPIDRGATEAQTSVAAAQTPYALGETLETKKQSSASPVDAAYPEVDWESLIPQDWDPTRIIGDIDFSQLSDNDPRAMIALRKLQDAWKNAPVNEKLDGSPARIAGFVVPLDSMKGQMKEFLLVPYFGACIHAPPPPSNQIIHVVLPKGSKPLDAMAAVWVSGTLTVTKSDTSMGSASYGMSGDAVEPYSEAPENAPR